jgi:hypothetical protein
MPAPRMTQEEWNEIVAVFAKHDGRITVVAEELGFPEARTRRLWVKGYPSAGFPPIRTTLAKDELAADEVRAKRQELLSSMNPPTAEAIAETLSPEEQRRVQARVDRERLRAQVRADAIKSRAEEATLVSMNRRNAIALNGVTAQILKGAMGLAGKIQHQLEEEAVSGKLDVRDRLALVRQAAQVARFNSEAAAMAIKAERLVAGDPANVGLEDDEREGSLAGAVRWIELSVRAVERARARGLVSGSGAAPGGQKP